MAIIVSEFRCFPGILSVPGPVTFTVMGTRTRADGRRLRLECRLGPENGIVFSGGEKRLFFDDALPDTGDFSLTFGGSLSGAVGDIDTVQFRLFDGEQEIAQCFAGVRRPSYERPSLSAPPSVEAPPTSSRPSPGRPPKSSRPSMGAPPKPTMMPLPTGRPAQSHPESSKPQSRPTDDRSTDDRSTGGSIAVWFGTNRKPEIVTGRVSFTSARDQRVHYGTCKVAVPASHRIGSIGSPWWKRLFKRVDDRLKIVSVEEMNQEAYWDRLAGAIRKARVGSRDAVVFLHGFNVAFEQAALRAAQLGYDLGISGAMSFYSWPSQGIVTKYPDDEASIEASEDFIADYLVSFATRSGAERVHLIAHSMGNRGLLRAIHRIAAAAQVQANVRFSQIILAAADVDQDTFRSLSVAYQRVADRTTMYVCSKDRAVEASRWLHGYPRAGLTPPVLVVPGIDTISVSNLDLTLLGHGYVAEARDVLQDMHHVLRNVPLGDRFALRRETTDRGEAYWVVGA
jgi:esterase/lipase superfamily enzyme